MSKKSKTTLLADVTDDQIVIVAVGIEGTGETLNGNAQNNLMVGHHEGDTIFGNDGADTIYGGHGNDQIDGGSGDDYIEGNVGDDLLTGGAGSDTFVFRHYEGHDTIIDLEATDFIQADFVSYEIIDNTILFHTIEGDPTWDYSVDFTGVAPPSSNFISIVI